MAIQLIKVGEIIHYYDKISVAVLKLENTLKVGDKVRFIRGGEDLYDQVVNSLQIEHKEVNQANKGDEPGMAVEEPLKDATEVFKIEEESK